MRKSLLLYFFAVIFLPLRLFGQVAEFTVSHTYMASRDYTFGQARAAAMQEAQAALLQQLGVLVESRQNLVRREVDGISQEEFLEEARTYTLGRVQTTVQANTESFAMNADGAMVFSATFNMAVDTADLFSHLNQILAQRQQARADSIAQVERARTDSIARVEQMRADSIARAQRIASLEEAVRVARQVVQEAQERERPIRIERSRKGRELTQVREQKVSAQTAFYNARNLPDAHTAIGARRIENERLILEEVTNEYNRITTELRIIHGNWNEATQRVQTAQNNLQIAEAALVTETGAGLRATQPVQQAEAQREMEAMHQRQRQGEFDTRAEMQGFAERMRNREPTQEQGGRRFVFSARSEFAANSNVSGAGLGFEFGFVGGNGLYLTWELNGGALNGGGINVGKIFNKNARIKNVLGASAGFRTALHFVDVFIDEAWHNNTFFLNSSIGGPFWKIMFGQNGNLSVINRVMFGRQSNVVGYSLKNGGLIYEDRLNVTYNLGIGFTLIRARR